jgi:hypothetical protein
VVHKAVAYDPGTNDHRTGAGWDLTHDSFLHGGDGVRMSHPGQLLVADSLAGSVGRLEKPTSFVLGHTGISVLARMSGHANVPAGQNHLSITSAGINTDKSDRKVVRSDRKMLKMAITDRKMASGAD